MPPKSSNQPTNKELIHKEFTRHQNMKFLDVQEWEVLCPECDGEAYFKGGMPWDHCEKCYGDGKLDWIELITGKPEPRCSGSSSCSSSSSIPQNKTFPKLNKYLKMKEELNVNKNLARSRTIQRLPKVPYKSKRSM